MRLLLCLAEHAGEVVSIDDLLSQAWPDVTVTQDSVYQAVASLRRLLGDDPRQPTYIATAPRLGYRMVAKVAPWVDQKPSQQSDHSAIATKTTGRRKAALTWAVATTICLMLTLLFALLYRSKRASNHPAVQSVVAPQPEKAIAVLPFLDLTEGMKQEEFADGMTEELIDKLSKISGLRVTPPTSSFYFKGKQITVGDVAKSLGVAYVLDGSVRKSGVQLRVAARLIRADGGYVVWSETYDRPLHDILMVQDDIAGEVTKALSASIGDKTGGPASPSH